MGVERAILFYDRDCGICNWTAVKVAAWDRLGGREPQVRLEAIQSPVGDRWLGDLSHDERYASLHVVNLRRGGRLPGGEGTAALLWLLPYGSVPAFFVGLCPPLTRIVYRWIADHRTQIGRRMGVEACRVPPPAESVDIR